LEGIPVLFLLRKAANVFLLTFNFLAISALLVPASSIALIFSSFPVIFYGQRVGSSFYNFIGIGIVERKVTAMLAFHQTTRNGKVIESAVLFTFFESGWDGNGAVGFNPR
jgi:hypothetical protein